MAEETTGRFIVAFNETAQPETVARLADVAGVRMAFAADFGREHIDVDAVLQEAGGIYFDSLHAAVVNAPPTPQDYLGTSSDARTTVLAMEPERYVYASELRLQPVAMEEPFVAESPREYLRGYRDAAVHIFDSVFQEEQPASAPAAEALRPLWTDGATTWGLVATNVPHTTLSGRGVRIAVLDTGFTFGHPDFVGRSITAASFVAGETPDDVHGHGTHCIGTAAGPTRGSGVPRYGIAYEAEIFAGKVHDRSGRGSDGNILAGIDWAVKNGCRVVSMSLGRGTSPGEPFSRVYETTAQRALAKGTLIVAAAGNEAQRPSNRGLVDAPANCPSIFAVAAIDNTGSVAFFSCGGTGQPGGEVNIARAGRERDLVVADAATL